VIGDSASVEPGHKNRVAQVAWVAAAVGIACLGLVLPVPEGLTTEAFRALLLFAAVILLWIVQPIDLAATALIGMAGLPVLGIMGKDEAFTLFGNQAVFFVMGVFIMAAVLMHTGLATRAALLLLSRFDRSPTQLATAVLVIATVGCAFLVSHAVAAILFPILLEICRALNLPHGRSAYARRLLPSMAWGTIAGSNLTFLSSVRVGLAIGMLGKHEAAHGTEQGISFLFWILGALPAVVLMAIAVFIVLSLYHRAEPLDMQPAVVLLHRKVREMGRVRRDEWIALGSLATMLVGMAVFGEAYGFGTIALLAGGLNFVLGTVTFEAVQKYVSWGIVLLFGGAVALASAVEHTQAVGWVAQHVMPGAGVAPLAFIAIAAAACMIMTEFSSNSAVIASLLPVCMEFTGMVGFPAHSMVFVTVIAAGMAFMLPVSTPAMAMVFSSGYLRTRDSLVPGMILNLISLVVIVLLAWLYWPAIGVL